MKLDLQQLRQIELDRQLDPLFECVGILASMPPARTVIFFSSSWVSL